MNKHTLYTTSPQLVEGIHTHLTDGLDGPCVACGALLLWVAPVEPDYVILVHPGGPPDPLRSVAKGRYALVRIDTMLGIGDTDER